MISKEYITHYKNCKSQNSRLFTFIHVLNHSCFSARTVSRIINKLFYSNQILIGCFRLHRMTQIFNLPNGKVSAIVVH